MVSYNTASLTEKALGALKAACAGVSVQIIVVDNASRDDSVQRIRAGFPEVSLIVNERNVGFGRANNQALSCASARYILLVNTDTFVPPGAIREAVAYMDANPRAGVLGVKLTGADGTLQPSARRFPTPWGLFLSRTGLCRLKVFARGRIPDDDAADCDEIRRCDWVPGCFYLVRRSLIDQIGLFDPRFFLYYEEVDHCLRTVRAGWEVVYYPKITAVHLGGESAKLEGPLTSSGRQLAEIQVESELLYFRKNYGRAGLWKGAILALLADAIVAAKRLLKLRGREGAEAITHGALVLAMLLRTRFGVRPTR